jgi:outer membrane protein assembly factor BamD (BamD/ComL family)
MDKIKTYAQYEKLTLEAVEDFNHKRYKQAIPKFIKLAAKNQANPLVHEILTRLYLETNDLENAEREYHIYLDLVSEANPALKAHMNRSFEDVVEDLSDVETLSDQYETLMKQDQTEDLPSTQIPIHLGIQYMAQGNYKKAEAVLEAFRERFVATKN